MNIGDVVRLKSDGALKLKGQLMTVISANAAKDLIGCAWTSASGSHFEMEYPEAALDLAQGEQ